MQIYIVMYYSTYPNSSTAVILEYALPKSLPKLGFAFIQILYDSYQKNEHGYHFL